MELPIFQVDAFTDRVLAGNPAAVVPLREWLPVERMQAIVARHLPRTGATLRFDDGAYPPMTPTPGNESLLEVLDRASRDLGLGPVPALDPGERGAGDIGFISHLLPSLDGLGSGGGGNSHAPGEFMALDTLTPMAQRSALLIYRLTR